VGFNLLSEVPPYLPLFFAVLANFLREGLKLRRPPSCLEQFL
jgi:hypothetical protein